MKLFWRQYLYWYLEEENLNWEPGPHSLPCNLLGETPGIGPKERQEPIS